MKKNIIIGLAIIGGIIILGLLTNNEPSNQDSEVEENITSTLPGTVTSEFPIFPNTSVISQNRSTNEEGKIFYSFSLEAESSIKEINDWYRESLNRGGWSVTSDRNIGGYQIIQAEKDNLFTSMQAARGENSNTSIISQQAQVR